MLLATLNGSLFLDEQIRSVFSGQNSPPFRIIARDDGSTDGTINILKRWASASVNFSIVDTCEQVKSPALNFSQLMDYVDAPYFAFSDQDDVWLPRKLHLLHSKLQNLENIFGKDTPLLVHSDLMVVDKSLNVISPSLWRFQGINSQNTSFSKTLVQNVVTGCAMMANRALLELAKPIPNDAIMHDWWLALVASAFGVIESIPEPLVMYRQHGANSIGARNSSFFSMSQRATKSFGFGSVREALAITTGQCDIFLRRYGSMLTNRQRLIAEEFSGILSRSFVERRRILMEYRLFPSTLLKKLLWLTWA